MLPPAVYIRVFVIALVLFYILIDLKRRGE